MNRDEWYRSWFGQDYLALYPHRNRDEARQGVELLLSRVQVSPGSRLLDLACGAGRHLEALSARGVEAVGVDLSSHLLARARETVAECPLVRSDMRHIPFSDNTFHVVTSFFTSFGYFSTEEDNRQVLAEVRRILRPGGTFLLDFLNAHKVTATLRPRDRQVIRGREVVQERRLLDGGRFVEKRIQIGRDGASEEGAPVRTFMERVRLYRPSELSSLLGEAGFQVTDTFGDYRGGALGPDSPRVILLARSPALQDPVPRNGGDSTP